MSMTGIELDDTVLEAYQKFGRNKSKTRWLVFRINKKQGKVLVEAASDGAEQDSEKAFEEMLEHLTPENNRYAAIKLTYTADDGRHAEDIALIMWRGGKTKSANRMVYAGTAGAVKNALPQKAYHEYDNKGELTHEDLVNRCKK